MTKFFLFLFTLSAFFLFAQEEQLAQRYYDQGKYNDALELYQDLYKKNNSPLFYQRIVSIYRALQDYEGGISFIKTDLKKNKNNEMQNRVDLIFFYKKLNNEKAAVKEFTSIEKAIQEQPGLVFNLQKIFSDKGLFREALELIIVAEKADKNMRLTYQKATMYAELGQLDNMYLSYIDLIEESAGYLGTVKALLSRSLETDSEDKYNILIKENLLKRIQKSENEYLVDLLIFVFMHEGNFSAALQQRIGQDRRRQGTQSEVLALGKLARDNGDFNTAFEAFDYILEKRPPSINFNAARVERFITMEEELSLRIGDNSKDYRDLSRAIRDFIGENDWNFPGVELAIPLARVEGFGLGEYSKAAQALKKMDAAPRLPSRLRVEGKILLGDIQLLAGNYTEALVAYAQAEKTAGDQPLADEAKLKMGKVAYFQGDFDYALNTFDVLKASTSKHTANDAMKLSLLIRENTMLDTNYLAMTQFAQADLFFYRRMHERALNELQQLRDDFPKHSLQDEILLLKGKIFKEMGNFQSAVDHWEKMLKEFPKGILSDEAHFLAAEVYRDHLRNPQIALEHFEKIITDYPNSYFVAEARRMYRTLRGDTNF